MTLLEAAAALRRKAVSSAELTADALAAIGRLQPKLNAFITVCEEQAVAAATAADEELARGRDRGPLHGVPIAVKDVFSTAGARTTAGSKVFADNVPDRDAAVVERLRAAGAVIAGKTNMHELAYGITSQNPHFGAVRNPWNPDRIPGGSSGGSGAAVAAGAMFMAMGSDTGGSIRIPASFCGTVGLKPTFGRVSRYGVLPLDFTLDHMGPLARSVRDAAAALNAIAGYDTRDDSSSRRATDNYVPTPTVNLTGARIGMPENFYLERVDADVSGAVQRAANTAERLGARIVPVHVPDIAAINTVGRVILLSEASAIMEPYLADRGKFGADVLALLDQGRLLSAMDYINAQRVRRVLRDEFRRIWRDVDVLFTPTTPTTAPGIGDTLIEIDGVPEDVRLATTRLVRGINVLGVPALSLPCGLDRRGLPIGLQIVAPAFEELMLLRVGAALEDALGFVGTMPPGL